MAFASTLCVGSVMHRRLAPRRHHFRYKAFWLFLDLDEIPAHSRSLRWFSYNKPNLFSLYDRDHGNGSSVPLTDQIREEAKNAGIAAEKIFVLLMPRVLGYTFNPLSTFFCYDAGGVLTAIRYEVHNTFGERHTYLLPVDGASGPVKQTCRKSFYVSPFLGMAMRYDFRVAQDDDRINIGINVSHDDQLMLCAVLTGEHQPLTDRNLLKLFFAIPLQTFKVTAAIHWQALKLWRKGLRIFPKTHLGP
ncbi:DUF1365 domain-containing protein [Rhizomicrobium electricum]|uniref:DUF1365 domain-containing protein n=1 Tax=Rhizomicrobium electricum TaxID=480070 RepID=A0ABP3Q6S2_9PROT|nr:DUF1365 domain-containing protein [Rhizomicrobium electricum]NIJ46703.1 hypothetical protein [Rhizomicrobium electricum]